MRTRDMTKAQYVAAMRRHGWTSEGFLGYWRWAFPNGKGASCVSDHNYGPTRRAKLAGMIAELEAIKDRYDREFPSGDVAA